MAMQTPLLPKVFALLNHGMNPKNIDKEFISKDWRPFALHGGEYRRLGHTHVLRWIQVAGGRLSCPSE